MDNPHVPYPPLVYKAAVPGGIREGKSDGLKGLRQIGLSDQNAQNLHHIAETEIKG